MKYRYTDIPRYFITDYLTNDFIITDTYPTHPSHDAICLPFHSFLPFRLRPGRLYQDGVHGHKRKLENILDPRRSRMMPIAMPPTLISAL